MPYSSNTAVPIVLSTGNDPSDVPPSDTATVASLVSAAVDIASDDREKVTPLPAAYVAGAPAGKATPTARWL